jgi:hypothetical protein
MYVPSISVSKPSTKMYNQTVANCISPNFGEFHRCKNWKFENFGESQLTHLFELQGSLSSHKKIWYTALPNELCTKRLMFF